MKIDIQPWCIYEESVKIKKNKPTNFFSVLTIVFFSTTVLYDS